MDIADAFSQMYDKKRYNEILFISGNSLFFSFKTLVRENLFI
jgi:glycosylphosphatidylinositol transamidase (GPIT) subunit GPI8